MRSTLGVLAVALVSWLPVAPAAAGGLEGEWIGALLGSAGSLFLHVRIGGEGGNVAGRADIPTRGELGILLHDVEADDRRLAFEIPGNAGNLRIEGTLTDDGRIAGTVAQRAVSVRIELVRLHSGWRDALRPFLGTYLGAEFYAAVTGAPGEAVLLSRFAPGYFEARTAWLRERVDESRPIAAMAPADALAATGAEAPPPGPGVQAAGRDAARAWLPAESRPEARGDPAPQQAAG